MWLMPIDRLFKVNSHQPRFPGLWLWLVVISLHDWYQQTLPTRPGFDQKEQVTSCPAASLTGSSNGTQSPLPNTPSHTEM